MVTDNERRLFLMSVFRFDNQDLCANRQGLMSERQASLMRSNAITLLSIFTISGIAFTLYITGVLAPPMTQGKVIVGLTLGGLWILIGLVLYWILRRDYAAGIVKCARGQVTIRPAHTGFSLLVGGEQLPVVVDLRAFIKVDDECRVYYAPTDRRILSIEFLHEGSG